MFIPTIARSLRVTALSLCIVSTVCRHAAAGTDICGDVDGNGNVVTTDALRLLRFAVGQPVSLECPTAIHCWDSNSNNICDAEEDKNGDQACGVDDCQGPKGDPGPAGPVVYSGRVTGFPGNSYWYGAPSGTHEGSLDLAAVEMLSPPYDTILTSIHGQTVSGGAGGNLYFMVNGDLATLACAIVNGSCSTSGTSAVLANSKIAFLFAAPGFPAQDYLVNLTLKPCDTFCGGTCCAGSCCGDVCVDTSSDEANCGSCGNVCTSTNFCVGGMCHCIGFCLP